MGGHSRDRVIPHRVSRKEKEDWRIYGKYGKDGFGFVFIRTRSTLLNKQGARWWAHWKIMNRKKDNLRNTSHSRNWGCVTQALVRMEEDDYGTYYVSQKKKSFNKSETRKEVLKMSGERRELGVMAVKHESKGIKTGDDFWIVPRPTSG